MKTGHSFHLSFQTGQSVFQNTIHTAASSNHAEFSSTGQRDRPGKERKTHFKNLTRSDLSLRLK